MKKRTTKEETAGLAARRTAGAADIARLRSGQGGAMEDASAATSTLQRYQQLASEVPEAMQLRQRAEMMSASVAASAMRAPHSDMTAPVQRAPDEELVQAKAGPVPRHEMPASTDDDTSATSSEEKTGSRSLGDTVQMAGHDEDLCFVGKWLVKRADSMEIAQYLAHEVPPTAPAFHGPFYTEALALNFLHNNGEAVGADKLAKIHLMAQTMLPGGKGFMMLANATTGMGAPTMRDLKMGKDTVSGTDQERHGVTGVGKLFKVLRHNAMDWYSGSSELGFRDEDQWKLSPLADNTDALQKMLFKASKSALQMIFSDLWSFHGWLNTTNVVYVGMSLLVVAGGDTGKAVAIDFEHPITTADASFRTHLAGLLIGAENLLTLTDSYLNSYEERAAAKRRAVFAEQGGNLNGTDEGKRAIGNDDL